MMVSVVMSRDTREPCFIFTLSTCRESSVMVADGWSRQQHTWLEWNVIADGPGWILILYLVWATRS